MAGYQLYEIYARPVYQQISPYATESIYIIPKTPYTALANYGKEFFLVSKEYYDNYQKTFYNTICENTQPKHEVSTTNSCECLMLIRPSKDTIPFVICLDLFKEKSGANKHQLYKRKIGKRLPQQFRATPTRYRMYCKDEIYHPK